MSVQFRHCSAVKLEKPEDIFDGMRPMSVGVTKASTFAWIFS